MSSSSFYFTMQLDHLPQSHSISETSWSEGGERSRTSAASDGFCVSPAFVVVLAEAACTVYMPEDATLCSTTLSRLHLGLW